eukprot:1060802-Pyramimonas_sp.AAC.1
MAVAAKKPRLTSFGKKSHVTASALAALLDEVSVEGLPEAWSRQTQARHRAALCQQTTSFGPLLQSSTIDVDGTPIDIWVQSPLGFLEVACRSSSEFQALLLDRLEKSGGVLPVLVYSDEI